jgi:hypothetical protein
MSPLEVRRTSPGSRTRSANSTIVLVEWPMVKKVLVSSRQLAKALEQSASLLARSARCRKQKRAFVKGHCAFKEPTAAGGPDAAQATMHPMRELVFCSFWRRRIE